MPGRRGQVKINKPYAKDSREKNTCPIRDCKITTRADKLRANHLMKNVIFDCKGDPVGRDNEQYKKANKRIQDHTDYFRLHHLHQTSSTKDIFKHSTKVPAMKTSNIGRLFQSIKDRRAEEESIETESNVEDMEIEEDNINAASDIEEDESCNNFLLGANEHVPSDHLTQSSDESDSESEPILSRRQILNKSSETEITGSDHEELLLAEDIQQGDQQRDGIQHSGDSNQSDEIQQAARDDIEQADHQSNMVSVDVLKGLLTDIMSKQNKQLQDELKEHLDKLLNRVENKAESENYWITDDDITSCTACLKFASNPNKPSHLRSLYKNNFGIYKEVSAGSKYSRRDQNDLKANHLENPLHIWCVSKYKESKKIHEEQKEKDKVGSQRIVQNAVFCLKNGFSAFDFRKFNDKDALTLDADVNTEIKFPEKNDGLSSFFELRDLIYKEIVEIAGKRLNGVKNMSFSLDKVTCSNIPYTVIVTYYFHEGKIYIYLNCLHPMKSDEYDGETTAAFIGNELMKTLGLSKDELRVTFVQATYDGVYATQEERTQGGGSLSLTKHFAEWLGVEPGDFDGSWDLGHLLQLCYNDAFKDNSTVKAFFDFMFKQMSDNKSHQSGLRFKEIAEEFNVAYLTNKSFQETRWIRSVLRCLQAFLRNLPTFAVACGLNMVEAANNYDNATHKALEVHYKKLTNGPMIAFAVGITQILEIYSAASLSFQDIHLMACTIPDTYKKLEEEIQKLSLNWEWKDEDLKLAGIGNPSKIIQNLKDGKYVPHLTKNVKVAAVRRINAKAKQQQEYATYLENVGETALNDIQDDITEEDVKPGEIAIENFSDDLLNANIRKLQDLAGDILNLKERISFPDVMIASNNAFCHKINEDDLSDEEANGNILKILEVLKSPRLQDFTDNREAIVFGYKKFKEFSKFEADMKIEDVYVKFCKHYDDYEDFKDFFENLNIRTSSEAICETIGSIMNIQLSNGRNLNPQNLNKEVFCRFNLPPFHTLTKKFIPNLAKKWGEKKPKGFYRTTNRLGIKGVSSTLHNYRTKAEKKSWFPPKLFNKED